MLNPNLPRHDDISLKLDIGVLSDMSYPLISIPVRWKSWNLSKFYVPDYRLVSWDALRPRSLIGSMPRRSWRAHTTLSYYKCSQRPLQPSHKNLGWLNVNSLLYDYFYLLCIMKIDSFAAWSKIMHENLHSNVFFYTLLIVDCKLQSQYNPIRTHGHTFVNQSLFEL